MYLLLCFAQLVSSKGGDRGTFDNVHVKVFTNERETNPVWEKTILGNLGVFSHEEDNPERRNTVTLTSPLFNSIESKEKCYTMNFDSWGNDVKRVRNTASADACQVHCAEESRCQIFGYNAGKYTCTRIVATRAFGPMLNTCVF